MKCKKNNIIKKLSAVLTASALLLTGCSGAKSSTQTDQDLTYTDMLFDTVIKIQILDPADESILDGLKKLCKKYDTMFSTTNTDSELYKLNHANGQPFTVSSETANLIQEGIHYSELSGGAFDLTIEPVSALWDFKTDKPTVPSSDAIAQAVSHVDYTKVDIQDNTVTLEDPEAGIDLGAIAKGYIADQVKTYLKKQGIKHAIINLGGNVDVIGTKPDGSKYNIAVYNGLNGTGTGDVLGIHFDLVLPASGWSNGSITVAESRLVAAAKYKYLIDAYEASREEYLECNVRPKDISTTGFITFVNDTDPVKDITVNIVRLELSVNAEEGGE